MGIIDDIKGMARGAASKARALWPGEPAGNEVRPADLSDDERQALREALGVVKRWRIFLRQSFRLDLL